MDISRARRSLLYVPSDKPNMIEKAFGLKCDSIIFDLEDAINVSQKDIARDILLEKVVSLDWNKKEIFIRVNDCTSDFFYKDLEIAAKVRPHGIIVPKASEESVKIAWNELTRLEYAQGLKKNSIKIIPLIETAYGIENISSIIKVSRRIIAVQFGAEDLTRDLGIRRTKSGEEVWYARNRIVIACKAAGIEPIDTPFTDFNDEEGLDHDSNIAKNIGLTSKTCIHPKQIEIVNRVFSPSEEEIELAERIIAAAESEENKNKGAFALDGKMVDAPVIARARTILDNARLIYD